MAIVPALQLPDVEAMTAEEALLWAYEQFGDRMCLTCSWQRQSSVLVHMVFGELGLDIPVVELDTATAVLAAARASRQAADREEARLLPLALLEGDEAEGVVLVQGEAERRAVVGVHQRPEDGIDGRIVDDDVGPAKFVGAALDRGARLADQIAVVGRRDHDDPEHDQQCDRLR